MNLTKLKKIIVLSGRPCSGKTAILNDLCSKVQTDRLTTKCNSAEQEPSRRSGGDQRFTAVFMGCKIAISTAGDTADHIYKSFLYGEKTNADVLVLALSKQSSAYAYRTAEVAFAEIVRHHRLTAIVDSSEETNFAPPKGNGYVDQQKVSDIRKIIIKAAMRKTNA